MSQKNIPPRILPQNKISYQKFNQWKWQKKTIFPIDYKKPAQALMLLHTKNVPLSNTFNRTNDKQMYQLALLTYQHNEELIYLLNKLQILRQNPFLSPYEAKVLITELLWGKQHLKTSHKKVLAIRFYEEDLREAYIEARDIVCNPITKRKFKLPTYIRINTLSISIDDAINAFCKEGWNLLPQCNRYSDYLSMLEKMGEKDFIRDYHISELLAFPPQTAFYKHPGYIKGKFIYQDKGSCLSSFLLNPKQDSVVLDACAAPGKTTNHLFNIMNGAGTIYANDINKERIQKLNDFLRETETKAIVLSYDFVNMDPSLCHDVKYILIDPSCSYSGIFFEVGHGMRKAGIERRSYSLNMILRYALQMFPNVKRVVYTTCSLYPAEGELVVDDALKDVGNSYTLLNIKEMLWNEWESVSQAGYDCEGKCLRIVPELDHCQGYFIAVFERNFDVPVPPYIKKFKKGSTVYTIDELEKVKKVTKSGRVIETYLPKNRKPDHVIQAEKLARLKKFQKKVDTISKQVYLPNKSKLKYINPNLIKNKNRMNSETTTYSAAPDNSSMDQTNSSNSQQQYETFHSQLYP